MNDLKGHIINYLLDMFSKRYDYLLGMFGSQKNHLPYISGKIIGDTIATKHKERDKYANIRNYDRVNDYDIVVYKNKESDINVTCKKTGTKKQTTPSPFGQQLLFLFYVFNRDMIVPKI